jgi:ABC-type bacteriocin/lantibiotic exporter with double-glycine peptidase domain
MQQSMTSLLKRLWYHISPRRRGQFALLLALTVLSSFAEVVSLGAVLPFIGILTQPEKVFASPWLAGLVQALGITSGVELVLPLTVGFALAALIAGGLRLLLLWVSIRLGNATGADLSIEVYRRTLYQSYSVHIARSSSEIISGITQKVSTATSVLISVVTVITSTSLFVAIMMTLVAIDPVVAIVAALSFGSFYGLIAALTRRRLVHNSHCIAQEQTQVVKALQEGLGAVRDVLLDGTQKVYCNIYQKAILRLQRAGGENTFINQAPRYAMEALGMALIAIFVLALSHRDGGVAAALPILAMLALGAQRLLPIMQQLYGNWSVVAGSKAALADVLALLEQPLPAGVNLSEPEPLALKQAITFENVSFKYKSHAPWVLQDINLTIPKGSRVGIIGATGSGKSTSVDLIMGLLVPTQGQILVDGNEVRVTHQRAWQRAVAHVPQSIYLADTSIAENIAFGVSGDQIDLDLVRKSAQQARIAEFIESRPEAYSAIVGERGVRLSGGQRQRIGIARALYKQASVLIFDEATSALDNETEQSVMQAIEGLSEDLTVFIIAHRLTTLKNCTMIVELGGGVIKKIGTYQKIVSEAV